jgi:hypothetical protein
MVAATHDPDPGSPKAAGFSLAAVKDRCADTMATLPTLTPAVTNRRV